WRGSTASACTASSATGHPSRSRWSTFRTKACRGRLREERVSTKPRAVHWRTRAHVALALASQAGHAVLPLLREAVAREDHATARDAMAEAIVRAEASIEYAAQLKN